MSPPPPTAVTRPEGPEGEPSPLPSSWAYPPSYLEAPRPRSAWNRWGRHLLLFTLTAISIFLTGYATEGVAGGLKLAAAMLSILTAHEMGHYVACRYYRVDATLPFFVPAPMLSFVGTLGAIIRIRGPIPHRRALFDIGIAGPLAGFLVCLPVLWLGVGEARLVPSSLTDHQTSYLLGEPLLFQGAVLALRGAAPDGFDLSLGPLGLAAWFGLLVTALNMMPVGQLDGGHVTYALVRARAVLISRTGIVACLALLYFHPSWIVWSLLLLVLGRRSHPPTLNDQAPLGRARVAVGILGFAVFALCFTPSPFVMSWADFLSLTSR